MECGAFLHSWRQWIRFVVVVVYIVLLVIALPLCIWELERNGASGHFQAWFVGGMFVLMALPISFWGILQHVINYTEPHLQRYIIRILWMVPIYALNAWFALRFPGAAIYLDTLRECYEAYVIYNFMAYLLSFLNHEYPHLDIQIENNPPVRHIFPFCLLPPCQYSPKFIQRCKHGVLQYTVVRPAMTVIALICEMFDKYSEGDFNFTTAWSYIVIINNVSQILAMYCLVLFYKAFRQELQPLKPVPKFLCVKFVVFLSFWQSLVIAALAKTGVIPERGSWVVYKDVKAVATGLQDFIICIEMFVAAIAHYFSFSHKPFVNLSAEQQNCCASFLSMWNVRDVTEDVVEHARYIRRGMHKTLNRGKRLVRGGGSEQTPLLADGGLQESGRYTSSLQNSQHAPGVKGRGHDDDAVSSGGESMFDRRCDTFANKSTTSSMLNYADFRSEASWQQDNRPNLSRSMSLPGCDSSGDELERENSNLLKKDDSVTQVLADVELGTGESNSRNVSCEDEAFHHLDISDAEVSELMAQHSTAVGQVTVQVHDAEVSELMALHSTAAGQITVKDHDAEVSELESNSRNVSCEDEAFHHLDISDAEVSELMAQHFTAAGQVTVQVHDAEVSELMAPHSTSAGQVTVQDHDAEVSELMAPHSTAPGQVSVQDADLQCLSSEKADAPGESQSRRAIIEEDTKVELNVGDISAMDVSQGSEGNTLEGTTDPADLVHDIDQNNVIV